LPVSAVIRCSRACRYGRAGASRGGAALGLRSSHSAPGRNDGVSSSARTSKIGKACFRYRRYHDKTGRMSSPPQHRLLSGNHHEAAVRSLVHRKPCESRGSRTVLGARGGEILPRDSSGAVIRLLRVATNTRLILQLQLMTLCAAHLTVRRTSVSVADGRERPADDRIRAVGCYLHVR
jgi:hypothetical protein